MPPHRLRDRSGSPETLRLPDGTQLGCVREGDPRGRPLLYFHGWPGTARQAALAREYASEAGWNIVAFDRPGLGRTPLHPGTTLQDWARRMHDALDILGWETCHLLGVSGGAPYVHACVARKPERYLAAGLCCGAPPFAELDHEQDLFPAFRLLRKLHRHCPSLSAPLLRIAEAYLRIFDDDRALRPWLWLLPGPDRETLRDPEKRRRLTASVRSAYWQGPAGIIADGENLLEPWPRGWRKPRVPLFFWHGAEDRTIPLRMARWTAGQIEAPVHFRVFPGEGHYSLPLRRLPEMLDEWR